MVNLNDHDIAEFQELVLKETGVSLSADEARGQAENLIRLVALVLRKNPR